MKLSVGGIEHILLNVGGIDRTLRMIVGAIFIALVFVGPKTLWGWIGIVPLTTGLLSFCPLYPLLGINTSCSTKRDDSAAA